MIDVHISIVIITIIVYSSQDVYKLTGEWHRVTVSS